MTGNCPTCGQEIPLSCEFPECSKAAEYEGWFRGGGMVRKMLVCPEHIELSVGRQAGEPLPTEVEP